MKDKYIKISKDFCKEFKIKVKVKPNYKLRECPVCKKEREEFIKFLSNQK